MTWNALLHTTVKGEKNSQSERKPYKKETRENYLRGLSFKKMTQQLKTFQPKKGSPKLGLHKPGSSKKRVFLLQMGKKHSILSLHVIKMSLTANSLSISDHPWKKHVHISAEGKKRKEPQKGERNQTHFEKIKACLYSNAPSET